MRIGIALGGGGAKGIAHIAVLRVLESAGIPIHIITGTSAGAIIGALYAAGKSPDEIEALTRRLTLPQWLVRDRTGMGLFSTNGIRRILEAEIGEEARIESLPRRFAAIAVDMETQEQVVIDAGPVARAACASAAFPGLFAPVRIDGHSFLDGGLIDPVPFDAARWLGADRVIAVDLLADEPAFTARATRRHGDWFYRLMCAAEDQKISRVVTRSIGIMTRQLRESKMEQSPPDALVCPAVESIGLMDFYSVDECLAAGEIAARAALPEIHRMVTMPAWRYESRRWSRRMRRVFAPRARRFHFWGIE
ncbi:MAG: patatin-like phospholipase family protein [Chloroflexota bacterium]|nr:patatin-like phospholipase family protein [Chloroflexota bacterium]